MRAHLWLPLTKSASFTLAKKSPSQKTAIPCRRCKRSSLGARSRCSQWISPSQIRDLAKKWIRYRSTKIRLIRPWFSCLWFVVGGEEAVAGVCRRTYSVHSTYVFFVTRATIWGKIVKPAVWMAENTYNIYIPVFSEAKSLSPKTISPSHLALGRWLQVYLFFPPFFVLSPISVFFAEKVNPRWLQLNLFFCFSWILLSPLSEESMLIPVCAQFHYA
jgi:hypothetical protein